jgi:hypothetical protein
LPMAHLPLGTLSPSLTHQHQSTGSAVPPPHEPEQEDNSDNENGFDVADAQGDDDDDALSHPEGVSDELERNENLSEQLPERQPKPQNTTRSGRKVRPTRRVLGDEWTNYSGFYSGRKKVRLDTMNDQFLAIVQWTQTTCMLDSYKFRKSGPLHKMKLIQ